MVDVDHRLASVRMGGPEMVYRIVMGVSHNHSSVEISEELVTGAMSRHPLPGGRQGGSAHCVPTQFAMRNQMLNQ